MINFEKAIQEYKNGRELVSIIVRMGGNREDYNKLYNYVKFGKNRGD